MLLKLCVPTAAMVIQMTRSYSELIKFKTIEERFEYLRLDGTVGKETFGYDRYLNQMLYKHPKFLEARDEVIIRDGGCDLGVEGYGISGAVYVHHMNPVTKEDILYNFDKLVDPEYLISSSKLTHDAIHYGDANLLPKDLVVRTKNDTCPWRRN